jgi:GT2 family glycosyltransferase
VTGVSAVMVAYDNEDTSLTRLRRDLLPALASLDRETDVIVIDNSPQGLRRLRAAVVGSGVPWRYQWNQGENLFYGPAMNMAAGMARHPHLLYVCSEHGESYDPTWARDLLTPLADEEVAMAGSLQYSGPPEKQGFDPGMWPYHIQGGAFAARTSALAAHPYPNGKFAHWGSDIYQCFQLQKAGFRFVDVPTVKSVYWHADLPNGSFKYVHDSGKVWGQ